MSIFTWLRSLFSPSSFWGTVHNNAPGPLEQGKAQRELLSLGLSDLEKSIRDSEAQAATAQPARFSENFTEREVACRDKGRTMPTGVELENAKKAAEMMEAIRSHLGDRAITVNSWYRTPEYNRQVGGAKNSYHVKGMAVDFTVAGMTPGQVQRRLIVARDKGLLKIGGIGQYKTFTHADIGPKRTWQG